MPSQEVLTLLIDAKNLASAQLKGLQKDLKNSADESERFGAVMGRAGTIAKGVLAAGLGLAVKGASDMANVQARLQAETGKSAEEAHRMARAINDIAGATAASLPSVSAAFSKVVTDLGLSGKQAEETTKLFVQFAKVSGQDASDAVSKLDDIIDAWGLTAADAKIILDKLWVSHQKYGGVIGDNEAALAALAPAMRAVNMTYDQAISLLNVLASRGVGAETAIGGLKKALANVSSPQQFRSLISEIANTSDAFTRAKLATDLFGKSGVEMGNALAGVNLDEFGISAEEAAGKVADAGEAIDNTFTSRIARALSGGQAAIRAFGDDWSGLLTTLSGSAALWQIFSTTFGVNLSKAILGTAAAQSVINAVTSAGGALGMKFGVTMGGAARLGFVAALVAGAALIGVEIGKAIVQPAIDAASKRISSGVAAQIKTGTNAQLQSTKEALQSGLKQLDGVWDAGILSNDARAKLNADLEEVNAEIARRSGEGGEAGGKALTAGYQDGSKGVTDGVKDTMKEVVKTISAARSDVQAAWKSVFSAQNDAANAADQITINNADIVAQKKIIASKKSTAVERAEANIRLRNLRAENAALQKQMADSGDAQARLAAVKAQLASREMMKGLKSRDPEIRQNWEALQASLTAEMASLEADAAKYGSAIARKFGDGLASQGGYISTKATFLVGMARDFLKTGSPAKRGPFSEQGGPDGMGRHLGEMWAKGLGNATSSVRASAGKLASSAQEPLGPRAAAAAPTRAAAAPAGGGSVHLHVSSMFPPSQAQISQWADLLDREFRRRQPRFSAYASGA